MASNIGSVTMNVLANTTNLVRGMSRARRTTESAVSSMKKAMVGLVSIFAGAQIVSSLKDTADELDRIGKVSSKLGIPADKLMELHYAADKAGVATGTLDMAMQRMTRRVAEAGQGTGEAVKALKELNLSAENMNKLSPDEQFKEIADAMKGITSQTDKVRIAFKLFDSGGVDLINMMKDGSKGLNEMSKEARDLGFIIDGDLIKSVEDMNDEFSKTGGTLTSLKNGITTGIAPGMTALLKMFNDATKGSTVFADSFDFGKSAMIGYAKAVDTTTELIGISVELYRILTDTLKGFWTVFEGTMKDIGADIFNTVSNIKNWMSDLEKTITESKAFKTYWNEVGSWGTSAYNLFHDGNVKIIEDVKKVATVIQEEAVKITEAVEVAVKPYLEIVKQTTSETGLLLEKKNELILSLNGEGEATKKVIESYQEKNDEIKKEIGLIKEKGIAEVKSINDVTKATEKGSTATTQHEKNMDSLANTIGGSMTRSFDSLIEGTFNWKDAMKDMAISVLKQLIQIYIVQSAVNAISGYIGGTGSNAGAAVAGNLSSGASAATSGTVVPLAKGGVVDSPTYFGMSGGKTGLMGEAGKEAVIPLSRDASGVLGVGASPVNVKIENYGNDNVSVEQDEEGIRILIEQVESSIANGITNGTGKVGPSIQQMGRQGRL